MRWIYEKVNVGVIVLIVVAAGFSFAGGYLFAPKRVDDIDGIIRQHKEQLLKANNTIREITGKLSNLGELYESQGTYVRELEERIAKINGDIEELERILREERRELEGGKGILGDIGGVIGGIEGDIEAMGRIFQSYGTNP